MSVCPMCSESVPPGASHCPHCDTPLAAAPSSACPACAELVPTHASHCPHCNTPLPPPTGRQAAHSPSLHTPARAPASAFKALNAARRDTQLPRAASPSHPPGDDETTTVHTKSNPTSSKVPRSFRWSHLAIAILACGAGLVGLWVLAVCSQGPHTASDAPAVVPVPSIPLDDPTPETIKALFAADATGPDWHQVEQAPPPVREKLLTLTLADPRAAFERTHSVQDFCTKLDAIAIDNRPKTRTQESCIHLNTKQDNMERARSRNYQRESTRSRIKDKLNNISRTRSNAEDKLQDNLVLTGNIITLDHPDYEVGSIRLYRPLDFLCEAPSRCEPVGNSFPLATGGIFERLLVTTTETTFTSQGQFTMFVRKDGTQRVPLKSGGSAEWTHLVEADPTLASGFVHTLLNDQLELQELQERLSELGPDEALEPYERAIQAAEREVVALLPPPPSSDDAPPVDPPRADDPTHHGAKQKGRTSTCIRADSLVGTWRLTGLVTRANKPSWVGTNQFYELTIRSTADGLEADLVMTGYTPDIWLPAERQYTAHAPITVGCDEATLDVELASDKIEAERHVRLWTHDGALYGMWHDRGSTWQRHGATGLLVARPAPGDRIRIRADSPLPCPIRCRVEATHLTSTDGSIAFTTDETLEGCLSACR